MNVQLADLLLAANQTYPGSVFCLFFFTDELGLEEELLPVPYDHPSANKRYIYFNDGMYRLPSTVRDSMQAMEPFKSSFAWKVVREFFRKPEYHEDESIHSFVSRRFGDDLARYLINPMCRGIYAGDSAKLSVKSCFSFLPEYEQKYGSVAKGMLRAKSQPPTGRLAKNFKQYKWSMYSFQRGLGQLVDRMEEVLSEDDDRLHIYKNKPCTKLEFKGDKVQVHSGDEKFEVDHVISTCLSKYLASMLPPEHSELSSHLNSIPAVTVAVINLEYEGDELIPVYAFGHLVPSMEESTKIMGVIYDSMLFNEHNSKIWKGGTTRVTVMMGGAWYAEHFGDPDQANKQEMIDYSVDQLAWQLGFQDRKPFRAECHIQKECIPQYLVGHSQKLDALDSYIDHHRLPLTLSGASYRGVALNDVILQSKIQVEKLIGKLSR